MVFSGIHHATLIVGDEERASWFYGQVLGLQPRPRPRFKFPGLFYSCGDQELHLIIAARPLGKEDLFIRIDNTTDITRRFIHRHVAFVAPDFEALKKRLHDNNIEIVFDPDKVNEKGPDPLDTNLIESWLKMYGRPPIFCRDPFGNLLEIIPGRN
jgi:catechol 2,3-dioxygenase-like lactoylglutathione lyase family enzyme